MYQPAVSALFIQNSAQNVDKIYYLKTVLHIGWARKWKCYCLSSFLIKIQCPRLEGKCKKKASRKTGYLLVWTVAGQNRQLHLLSVLSYLFYALGPPGPNLRDIEGATNWAGGGGGGVDKDIVHGPFNHCVSRDVKNVRLNLVGFWSEKELNFSY
jgi:hypothetical protein